MQTLTYLISFIALGVLARAFLTGEKNNDPSVYADTSIILGAHGTVGSEAKDLNNYQDPSPIPQNDGIPVSGHSQPGSTNDAPLLIINAVTSGQNNNNGPLPTSINHLVTFFPQAPDGNRNLPRQEACEEASIVLANYFIKGRSLTRDQMRADILALVDRQMQLFNDYIHTTIEQTKQLYLDFYGGQAYILDNPSIQDIKNILAQGYIIVAPFAGRKLGNPYYSGQGPRYHMMVIKGYDDTYFYTNDVGTRRGENFRYTHAVIMEALHDLDYDTINQGAKRILVIME